MSFFDKLVDAAATVAAGVTKVARAVRDVAARGLSALAAVGKKVAATVEAGWGYVRPAVERVQRAVTAVLRPVADSLEPAANAVRKFVDAVEQRTKEKLGEDAASLARKAQVEEARRREETARAELTAREREEAAARARAARESEERAVRDTELAVRRAEDEALRRRFVELANNVSVDLGRLLESKTLSDFDLYVRVKTCADLALRIAAAANSIANVDGLPDSHVDAIGSLQALSRGEDLADHEWALLSDVCQAVFEMSLDERAFEQLFAIWSGERFQKEQDLVQLGRQVSNAKVEVRQREAMRAVEGSLTPEDESELLHQKALILKYEAEREVAKRRVEDLIGVSCVAEGLLEIRSGEEADVRSAQDAEQVGELIVRWQRGSALDDIERDVLLTFGNMYRVRARRRAERVRDEQLVVVS